MGGGASPAFSAVPKSRELLESLLTVGLCNNSRGGGDELASPLLGNCPALHNANLTEPVHVSFSVCVSLLFTGIKCQSRL